jgi:hypothetical protein
LRAENERTLGYITQVEAEVAMNWSTGLSWLAALKTPSADRSADEADCADMGTAFGLDASFGRTGDDPATMGRDSVSSSSLPWEYRLTRRSGL